VRLEVYDVSGRLVARLIDGERRAAGLNNVEWNGRDVSGRSSASGIYIYRLTAGKETISRKMVLLR
jgi:flagellar hook assembly protein FlgD